MDTLRIEGGIDQSVWGSQLDMHMGLLMSCTCLVSAAGL